jgi:FMN-dependent oxidoreductase (nitrilotriacetate monooxygenase family)
MRRCKMHLVAFLLSGPTSHHHAMWRHPETDNRFLEPDDYGHVARVLELGKLDALFFADVLALPDFYKGNFDSVLGLGGQMGLLDALPLIAIVSRVRQRLGLGVTVSTSFEKPFQLARSLGTLDILSEGRIAWNVVTTSGNAAARNFGVKDHLDRNTRYEQADEVLEACVALWESWEDGALVLDKASGRFADPSKVHYVNYDGAWVNSRGPLTVPRSPQGRPVIMRAGSSPRGRDFAARWAEVIFTLQHARPDMHVFCADMAERMGKYGRAANECTILTSVDPIVRETRSIAREKQDYINGLVDPELGIALSSAHIGLDLSHYPQDQKLADMDIKQGSRGSFDVILQGTRAGGLTLGEAAKRFAVSELCPQIVGAPADVADQVQVLFGSHGGDEFVSTPTVFPGMFEQFARAVEPELQRRGIFRTDCERATLQENLRAARWPDSL